MPQIRSSKDNRAKKAVGIIRYFRRLNDQPYRLTVSGAWAASRPSHLLNFFTRINLSDYRLFVDLGSGDGIACCMAGLFTKSIGIESDPFLLSLASRAARDLELDDRVGFIRADFQTQAIRNADCLYIYPNRPVYKLEEILAGWSGTLLIYGPHFPPRRFSRRETLRCGREMMTTYFDPCA